MGSDAVAEEVLNTLAPCGLNCRKCFAHVDGPIGRHARALKDLLGPNFAVYARRFSGLGMPRFESYPGFADLLSYLAQPDCRGCRSGVGCKWPDCGVRRCLVERGIEFCYQCRQFPCEQSGFDPHLVKRWVAMNLRMREVGPAQYLAETRDEPRYK